MKHKPLRGAHFFFATPALPCPYLPGRVERRVVTELVGRDVAALHDVLSAAGYRRSHGLAYVPACADCSACIAIRVLVAGFKASQSLRRTWRRNADVAVREIRPVATEEQYRLFAAYQEARHGAGDMARMDFSDYRNLIEDTPVKTAVIEFRDGEGRLLGACLMDRVTAGLSAVYSFFDPLETRRGMGLHMVLWLIERARGEDLTHVYLGYWVENSPKMAYKERFTPLEGFVDGHWRLLFPAAADPASGNSLDRAAIGG